MPTLILTPRQTPDSQSLWRAANRAGWRVVRLPSWRVPEQLLGVVEPVLYAEALFAPSLAAALNIELVGPSEDWLVQLPDHYRRRTVTLSPLGAARALTTPAFIKPPNDKSFPAAVYCGNELPTDFADDMNVLVAEIVHWSNEFRCFVKDRKLAAISLYARDGELQQATDFACRDEELVLATDFVTGLLADPSVPLPQAVVIDVGYIKDRGFAVVELNAAWGAGLYACNPDAVLPVLRAASFVRSNASP